MASESDILEEYQPFDGNLGQDFWKGIGKSGKPWTEEKQDNRKLCILSLLALCDDVDRDPLFSVPFELLFLVVFRLCPS